jgi:5-methylcytosine-specific restriction protein B
MSNHDKLKAPSVAAAAKTLKAALMVLSETGKRMPVSDILKAVEQRLTFTPWELIVNERTRDTKWKSILKFYSINAVKSNLITRGNEEIGKGWMITDKGREIAQLSEVEVLQYVRSKYKEWADENLQPKRSESKNNLGIKNYYLLCANPKIWKMADMAIGEEQFYTSINENGNKRQRYDNFQNLKKGDLLIGYESAPEKRIQAIFEVTQELQFDESLQQEVFYFKLNERISDGMTFEQLSNHSGLQQADYLPNLQGSLFRLTKEEYDVIYESRSDLTVKLNSYDRNKFDSEVFVENETIDKALQALKHKKNIILQGSPGVGKSYIAKRLAQLFLKEAKKEDERIKMVQFHQSYSYEDFVQGFRPNEDGNFKLTNGVFYQFCMDAAKDDANDYYFIIDEINRGNLSKIFGELMLLIEHDKRDEHYAVSLTYGAKSKTFSIPKNVHIIGTMNTADRSLALVDYALRRRFAFIQIEPAFNTRFQNHLRGKGIDDDFSTKLIHAIASLNKSIQDDSSLGSGFKVGHSYFTPSQFIEQPSEWLSHIIDLEIEPLLREYWFDNESKWKEQVSLLRNLVS